MLSFFPYYTVRVYFPRSQIISHHQQLPKGFDTSLLCSMVARLCIHSSWFQCHLYLHMPDRWHHQDVMYHFHLTQSQENGPCEYTVRSMRLCADCCVQLLIWWSPLVFGLWGSPVHRTPHAVITFTILSWPYSTVVSEFSVLIAYRKLWSLTW